MSENEELNLLKSSEDNNIEKIFIKQEPDSSCQGFTFENNEENIEDGEVQSEEFEMQAESHIGFFSDILEQCRTALNQSEDEQTIQLDENSEESQEIENPNYTKEILKCDHCDKIFVNRYSLNVHLRIHAGNKPFSCKLCPKTFHQACNLRTHMITHTGEKKFECPVCKKRFSQRVHVRKHQLIHVREQAIEDYREFIKRANEAAEIIKMKEKSAEEGCNSKEENTEDLPNSISVKEIFKCELCEKIYTNLNDLLTHETTHSEIKLYHCQECSRKFFQPSNLKTHMLISHSNDRLYECKICLKKFIREIHLKKHVLTHNGEKNFKCKDCNARFLRRGNLLKHERIHRGIKNAECPECHKKFYDKSDLKKHSYIHSGIKPFECHICHKKFSRSYNLKEHLVIHGDQKPYQCDFCFKVFSKLSLLKRHKERHSGARPFYCPDCDVHFSQASTLKKHKLSPKHIYIVESKRMETNSVEIIKTGLKSNHNVTKINQNTPNPTLQNKFDIKTNISSNNYNVTFTTLNINDSSSSSFDSSKNDLSTNVSKTLGPIEIIKTSVNISQKTNIIEFPSRGFENENSTVRGQQVKCFPSGIEIYKL